MWGRRVPDTTYDCELSTVPLAQTLLGGYLESSTDRCSSFWASALDIPPKQRGRADCGRMAGSERSRQECPPVEHLWGSERT